ncbi:tRNA lysidine(34) synthetase TilS [Desulfovibrio mangrovi]|uniref:tRNA lysidine(34) synthetase TilS n=1 Tax=Desulfovibrio mangrovi TaxID=2976983 RepID=UPI0022459DB4|nr:tRNA lysidine(34) synthetase TilS [Desulfovibrio mangrovi]UZP68353.1 tRNA lysidine(34) synthetase TilS [Desulfovibrio mangrovi]
MTPETVTLPQHLPRSLRELTPAQARLCLQAEQFLREGSGLEKNALTGKGLLIACSGGCDSTALLFILLCLKNRLGCRLTVAHLDHCLRPESAVEADHVRRLCALLDLPCSVGREDVAARARQHGIGIEEAARDARYAFLEKARQEHACDFIATAHHLNDLAEDVLMRLLRGTGWPALGGMEAFCTDRQLIRPLLVTERNKLETFLAESAIGWCEDASNADPAYLRNRIRADFLPLFLRENPAFLTSIAGLWRLARTDAEHWTSAEENILSSLKKTTSAKDSLESFSEHKEGTAPLSPPPAFPGYDKKQDILLPKKHLASAGKALRLRLYKRCLEKLGTGQALLEGLEKLDAVWLRNEGGKTIQFPGGKTATITGGNILFSRG